MANEAVKKYLIDSYNEMAYTHNYIFGWKDTKANVVYAIRVMTAEDLLPWITKTDRASSKNGGTIQLKFKPNKAQKAILLTEATQIDIICSVDYFEECFKNSHQNRGQIFESMIASFYGGVQSKQKNAKFTDCGDIIINDIHYQVKFEKATFTDERTIQNLRH